MVAPALELQSCDTDARGHGPRRRQPRGETRRVVSLAIDVKIAQLTSLVGEPVKRVQRAPGDSSEDSIADRLLRMVPRAEAAMMGEHGHVRNSGQRARGNLATHALKQEGAISLLSDGAAKRKQRAGIAQAGASGSSADSRVPAVVNTQIFDMDSASSPDGVDTAGAIMLNAE